jgi:hypothetical protein
MNTVLRVVGLALLAVLAGCSTPPEPTDDVATLETTGSAPPAGSVASTAPTASRPRERLDMTNDEINQMYEVYDQCLTDNGVGTKSERDAAGPQTAAAEAACLGKKPLPPWEYDTANPESADFVHAVVQCLRDKGVRYVDEVPATPGEDRRAVSFGGPNNDSDSISKGLNLISTCEKEMA